MRVPGAVAFQDPVLRILAVATFVATLGRGVFLTVTVLYFSLIIGLSALQISVVYAVAAAIGAGSGALAGHLSDVLSARRVNLASVLLTRLFLGAYAFAGDFWSVLVISSLESAAIGGLFASQSAIIARAFDGPHRVQTRAILRTITNIGIALGAGFSAIALAVGTPEAYRVVIVGAAALVALRSAWLIRLPAAVATLFVLFVLWVGQQPLYRDQLWFFARASRNIYEQHMTTGLALRDPKLPEPKRVLLGDAGAIPYISDLPALDIIGLGGYRFR